MRIAMTGASGNVGSALLRRFTADGHEVVGLARRLPEPGFGGPQVTWRSADLTSDRSIPVLTDAFRGADAVVHLAWGFQPSHDLAYLENLGVGGTRRVLDAVAAAGVPQLVHMSSLGAYSPKDDDSPVDESWPTGGVPTSRYSVHKSRAERLLDEYEGGLEAVVTRIRPGIIGQRSAGSALSRYALPAIVPRQVIDHVPVLPLDRRLRVSVVHADDVADAYARVIEQRAGGAFNLAADPPVTTELVAKLLGARVLPIPSGVLRAGMSLAWHARLQQVDTGWLDMGFALPLLDSSKARRELGWEPQHSADDVIREVLAGMREAASDRTPVLRRRTVPRALKDALTRGAVGLRNRP